MSSSSTTPPSSQRTFLGHPVGLYVLFFTEMWERFSYYGMRALLILYMVNYFKWSQGEASNIYKIYTSFVYITPILGGFLADRYLGNRLAVIIGAALMAVGHFLMAFETLQIFYAALIFLIIGNGFFKPNMSTQVGRLYPVGDGRRDSAYTIFYMGINLGAFLAPLGCGWLAENTVGGYHTGFTMAGIGMVLGLVIYLLGQPVIREIASEVTASPTTARQEAPPSGALTEAQAEREPSRLGSLIDLVPTLLFAIGALLLMAVPGLILVGWLSWFDGIMVGIAGLCALLVGWVCSQIRGGVRDRVLAILALGLFVIFFWAAFEQAGNVLNLWADKTTDRNLTQPMTTPDVYPEVAEDTGDPQNFDNLWSRFTGMFKLKEKKGKSWDESINPIPTTWFQSINAAAIVIFAPLFTFIWMSLDRRGLQPSIPIKMTLGLLLISGSIGVMIASAQRENKPTSVTAGTGWTSYPKLAGDPLPEGVAVNDEGKLCAVHKEESPDKHPFFAGRLTYDSSNRTLNLSGVLPDTERDHIVRQTAPEAFQKKVKELVKLSDERIRKQDEKSVSVILESEPPGFDLRYTGFPATKVTYDPATRTLTTYRTLADKDAKALGVAAGDSVWRDKINELYLKSSEYRVSLWWLFWSYMLATFGELCLSPVGLSMVSKLSPAKFATLLMGMWMLTSSFGNFTAGLFGELAEVVPPLNLFVILTAVTGVAAVILFLVSRKVVALMHRVN